MNKSLKLYVKKIKKLPTLPVIAQEILSLASADLTSVGKIEQVVENDPAISAKILSVANSVFFGVKVRTKTLDRAIMRIGFDNVKSIALGISLMTVLQNGKSGNVVDYKRIYNHSVTVGFLARLLTSRLQLDFIDEIVMNGMLHDVGYLVSNKYFAEDYSRVLAAFKKGDSLLDAEKKVLEFNHTDIGSWLVKEWNLPNAVLDTTLHHHNPEQAKRNRKRVAVIHLADYLATKKILSPTEKDPLYPFEHSSLEILNMTEKDYEDFEKEISSAEYSGGLY